MRKDNSTFKTKFISEPGSYLRNADYFAFVELQDYACYCIADGIDDDKKRHSAELAVTAVINEFYAKHGMSKRLLKRYLRLAHRELLKETKDIRLEVSILILVTNYKKIRWGCAGNTRLYHLRNSRVLHKSTDQSLSQNMAEQGEIALDRIEQHEERHNLYCYLGQPGRFSPFVSSKYKLEDGDIITLCTRGIWENTGVPEMLDAIEEASEPEDVCAGIEDIILSQQMKWISNYTIACTYVNKVYQNPKRKKILKKVAMICTPIITILLILGIVFTVRAVKKENQIRTMWQQIESGLQDIDKSGKIFEETNTFKQASQSYEKFASTEDIKKEEIAQAKGYIEIYKYIQEIETAKAEEMISYQKLCKQYCGLLALAYGSNYINQKVSNEELSKMDINLKNIETVDTTYLSDETIDSYEKIIKKYADEFETILVNAQLEVLYETTLEHYNDVSENRTDYVDKAKKTVFYDYNGTDFGDNLGQLDAKLKQNTVIGKLDDNIRKNIEELLNNAQELRQEIIGQARAELGNEAKEKGNLTQAAEELKKAQAAYAKTDKSDKAKECADAISEIEATQKENKKEKQTKQANQELEKAHALYKAKSYSEAKAKYNTLKKKFNQLGLDNTVSEIKEMLENIDSIEQAQQYVQKGKEAYQAKNYEQAKVFYETAEEKYKEVNLSDERVEIIEIIQKIEKKIEKEEEKKEQEKAKQEEEKANKTKESNKSTQE